MKKAKILVCGGGPAGCAAAVSAARISSKVLLVERYGFLGGMGTAGLVHPWMGYYAGEKQVVGGFFQEIVKELKKYNAFKDSEHLGIKHHCFDSEILKFILLKSLISAKVKILFHTFIVGAKVKGRRIKSIILQSKSGEEEIGADIFIDATGDGDVAFYAGAEYDKGRADGLMQPMTLHFRMAGVKVKRMPSREKINEIYIKAKKRGWLRNPRENLLWFDTIQNNVIHFNTTRVIKVDGTNRDDLTRAEISARFQTMELVEFLRKNIPGFENSYLLVTAPQVGVRETRRIKGEYTLTYEDIFRGKEFEDVIALGCWGIDIHSPKGEGTVFKPLPYGHYYQIPYRCLLPKKIENLIVAGRPISATYEAHSSTRIQTTCYATGQAAGVAAALAVKNKKNPKKINIKALQRHLIKQKAILK